MGQESLFSDQGGVEVGLGLTRHVRALGAASARSPFFSLEARQLGRCKNPFDLGSTVQSSSRDREQTASRVCAGPRGPRARFVRPPPFSFSHPPERGRLFDGAGWIGNVNNCHFMPNPGRVCMCIAIPRRRGRRVKSQDVLCMYHHFDQSKVTHVGRGNTVRIKNFEKHDRCQ